MQALRRSQSDQAFRGSPDAGSTSSSHSRREELPSALALLTGTSLAARSKMRCLDLTASRMEALPIMLRSFGAQLRYVTKGASDPPPPIEVSAPPVHSICHANLPAFSEAVRSAAMSSLRSSKRLQMPRQANKSRWR